MLRRFVVAMAATWAAAACSSSTTAPSAPAPSFKDKYKLDAAIVPVTGLVTITDATYYTTNVLWTADPDTTVLVGIGFIRVDDNQEAVGVCGSGSGPTATTLISIVSKFIPFWTLPPGKSSMQVRVVLLAMAGAKAQTDPLIQSLTNPACVFWAPGNRIAWDKVQYQTDLAVWTVTTQ